MTRYRTCRTCGKYIPAGEGVSSKGYCSEECARVYGTCVTCGRHFLRGSQGNEDHGAEHCSKECGVRYAIVRKYGPEPVTIVAEV